MRSARPPRLSSRAERGIGAGVRVSGILLAAGPSTRLGGGLPKQLLSFAGEPLVRRAARAALASRLAEVVVVLGHESERVRGVLAGLPVRLVDNPDYPAGQSTSVKAGLLAVDPAAVAALVLPCDQPFLTAEVIDALLAAYHRTGGPILLPACEGRRGSPVLFDRTLFPELAAITGDSGGRQLLPHHPHDIVEVPLASPDPLLDIDTREDLLRLSAVAAADP